LINTDKIEYQLALLEAESDDVLLSALTKIADLEKEKGRGPGQLIKRVVLTSNLTPERVEKIFIHLSDCCLNLPLSDLDWKKELDWLFFK